MVKSFIQIVRVSVYRLSDLGVPPYRLDYAVHRKMHLKATGKQRIFKSDIPALWTSLAPNAYKMVMIICELTANQILLDGPIIIETKSLLRILLNVQRFR